MAATYQIDFDRLRADALAGGFNPLTIIDAGGMSAYVSERPGAPAGTPPTVVPNLPTQGGHFAPVGRTVKMSGKGMAGAGGTSQFNLKAQAARAAMARMKEKSNNPPVGEPKFRPGVTALAPSGGGGPAATGAAQGGGGRPTMPVRNGISGPWREHPSDYVPNVTREQMQYLLPIKPPSVANPGREFPMGAIPWESNPYFPPGQAIEDEWGEGELSPATPILWVKTLADIRWNVDRLRYYVNDTYVQPALQQYSGGNARRHPSYAPSTAGGSNSRLTW